MRNLFIPPLGTTLILARDWTFDLYNEWRNRDFMTAMKDKRETDYIGYPGFGAKPATLPMGTELTIRRIYIRQGQGDFDSVTFSAKMGKKQVRFWVKLADANRIMVMDDVEELQEANLPPEIAA